MGAGDKLPSLAIDWAEVEQEATELLVRYLRIDTTNPPGGEEAGAELLTHTLRSEGFEPRLYEAGDGRVSVSARLPGTNSAGTKPIVLLSHIDVVPVERDYWSVDPFAGVLKDGVLWGRGALDMKGMGVMELLVLLLLKRHRVAHRRDILFLAMADEEEGSRFGMSCWPSITRSYSRRMRSSTRARSVSGSSWAHAGSCSGFPPQRRPRSGYASR